MSGSNDKKHRRGIALGGDVREALAQPSVELTANPARN
jgi:hypothetical protein